MELVSIERLRPGQTLAKAVTNAGGAILCPPGYRLTETAIGRLRNAGVESVIVESFEDKAPEIQARLTALHDRFQGIDDPIMLQLKAAIENRLNFMKLENA